MILPSGLTVRLWNWWSEIQPIIPETFEIIQWILRATKLEVIDHWRLSKEKVS